MNNALSLHRFALALAAMPLPLYFWGNSQPEAAGLIPAPRDKLVHLGWCAVLSSLLLAAFGRRAWPWVLGATLLLAGPDEWHQLVLPGREADWGDWLADAFGAAAGLGLAHALARRIGAMR